MAASEATIRVLLADDHAVVREAIAVLINGQPDMQVVAQAGDGGEAVQRAGHVTPDVAVIDLSMPRMGGLEVAVALKATLPGTRILVLTRHTEFQLVQQLRQTGVSGYVLKQSASVELVNAIRAVALGGSYFDPLATTLWSQTSTSTSRGNHQRPIASLSARELEILRLLSRGHANQEVAATLGISVKTVETHKANAMGKLFMTSRIELVRFAILQGWLRES